MDPLSQAIYLALRAALRLSPYADQSAVLIRQAFVDPAAPPPPDAQDVMYFHLLPESRTPLTETSVAPGGQPTCYHCVRYLLNLVFYGPRAEENAWLVYHAIFLDGYQNPRSILRRNGIYPIPGPSAPVRTWEIWKEQHRFRVDLTILLSVARNETLSPASEGSVEVPPEINLNISPIAR